MSVYVQFSGPDETEVAAAFQSPQDPDVWPNMAEVEDDDPRLAAYLNPPQPEPITDPLEKLRAFLLSNPDVAAVLNPPR